MNISKPLKFFLIALGIIFIIFIILISITKKSVNNNLNVSNTITTGADFNNLKPGVSTTEDIIKNLGNPEIETATGSSKILKFKSTNPNFNNELTTEDNKLLFIKQYVGYEENLKVGDINKKYGIYKDVLYGPQSVNGFNLYIYPEKGLAYVGHQEANIVLEMWYFPPTDIETFKKLYAQDYASSYTPPGQ